MLVDFMDPGLILQTLTICAKTNNIDKTVQLNYDFGLNNHCLTNCYDFVPTDRHV